MAAVRSMSDDGDPPTEEVLRCALCAGGAFRRLYATVDRMHALPGLFGLEECESCGLIQLSPRPVADRIDAYYPADYYTSDTPAVDVMMGRAPGRRMGRLTEFVRSSVREHVLAHHGYPSNGPTWLRRGTGRLLDVLLGDFLVCRERGFPDFVAGGKALDLGCGSGSFLAVLRDVGWEVVGVEPDESAAALGRAAYGLDIRVGHAESVDLGDERFDFIRMSHVLEHVYDPVSLLRRARSLLAPGGVLAIETPNASGTNAQRMGPRWMQWDSPRHLYIFGPETLIRALDVAGLVVRDRSTAFHLLVVRRDLPGTSWRSAVLRWATLEWRRRSGAEIDSGDSLSVTAIAR